MSQIFTPEHPTKQTDHATKVEKILDIHRQYINNQHKRTGPKAIITEEQIKIIIRGTLNGSSRPDILEELAEWNYKHNKGIKGCTMTIYLHQSRLGLI